MKIWKKKQKDLIISLLKSKESIAELFNDNRYDNEISDIRRILNRLRDILPKKDRKEIEDKLYKIEHQRNTSEEEQDYLIKLTRILDNKEKQSLWLWWFWLLWNKRYRKFIWWG